MLVVGGLIYAMKLIGMITFWVENVTIEKIVVYIETLPFLSTTRLFISKRICQMLTIIIVAVVDFYTN